MFLLKKKGTRKQCPDIYLFSYWWITHGLQSSCYLELGSPHRRHWCLLEWACSQWYVTITVSKLDSERASLNLITCLVCACIINEFYFLFLVKDKAVLSLKDAQVKFLKRPKIFFKRKIHYLLHPRLWVSLCCACVGCSCFSTFSSVI